MSDGLQGTEHFAQRPRLGLIRYLLTRTDHAKKGLMKLFFSDILRNFKKPVWLHDFNLACAA